MKTLVTVHLVQFSFWEYETFELAKGGTAFIGPNGAGKTSLVDAIQIALVGAHGSALQFNAQSVQKDARSLRDYALGAMRSGDGGKGAMTRKRDEAMSYITLVFQDEDSGDAMSAGLALWSTEREKQHRVLGMYVLPGVALTMDDHLVAVADQGMAPQEWSAFDAQVRKLSQIAGRQPTITTKPETYIDELLHNLADRKQTIDPRKFLKALKQSIRLKDVASVGDFLRENLVEATRIDKKGTLLHIQTLRRLAKQIEDVKLQLAELDTISKQQAQLALTHKRRATVKAVELLLQVERCDEQLSKLRSEEVDLAESIKLGEDSIVAKREAVASTFAAYEDLRDAYSRDPQSSAPEQARKLIEALKGTRERDRQAVEALEFYIADALQGLALAYNGRKVSDGQEGFATAARVWDARRSKGELADAGHVKEALSLLGRAKDPIGDLEQADRKEVAAAKEAKGATEQKLSAAGRGVRLRDDNVAAAMQMFEDAGIGCQTVSSMVQVTDLSWQCAIETFLARNRFAVVVEEGRERDAVSLLRRSELWEVTVVQPAHLRDQIGVRPEAGSVAALLSSSNQVAVAFLRRILGRMRCVETEAELEQHSRALTKDCMLSANGGTKRMRPLSANEYFLGAVVSGSDRIELRDELVAAVERERRSTQRLGMSREALEKVSIALRSVTVEGFLSALTRYQATRDSEVAASAPEVANLPAHLVELQGRVNESRVRHTEAQEALVAVTGQVDVLKSTAMTTRGRVQAAEVALAEAQREREASLLDDDYDEDFAQVRLASAYGAVSPSVDVIQALRDESHRNQLQAQKQEPTVVAMFVDFINRHSIGLVDERSDWRKATTWVSSHIEKLRKSTLVEYEQEAAAARSAAERAFEADVKYSLREALLRVGREIGDLNRILDKCPPFSNGERYHFSAIVDEDHKPLYNLVMQPASAGESSSLFESSEVQLKLVELMESAERGTDKGGNPLEDYRLFYKFDLEIRVDGKVVDLLSKRMGVASNGEHRVPFYVIAGATLATAYRIKPGERHRGAGVMILDEAFYGIDAQNTVVTAEFLKSLGLQLVMAGPDSDTSKLIAVLDSYYDLNRFGSDVFVERVGVKEAARELMRSDMPERNPALLERKVEQLELGAK